MKIVSTKTLFFLMMTLHFLMTYAAGRNLSGRMGAVAAAAAAAHTAPRLLFLFPHTSYNQRDRYKECASYCRC